MVRTAGPYLYSTVHAPRHSLAFLTRPFEQRCAVGVVLELRFTSAEAFADTLAKDLRHGRAFVPGASGLDIFTPVEFFVVEPSGARRRFEAVVVTPVEQQGEHGGVGLMLDGAWRAALEAEGEPEPAHLHLPLPDFEAEPDPLPEPEPGPPEPEPQARLDVSPQHRIKGLSAPEQIRLARTSAKAQERMLLERMLGKQVWEALLSNARITVPEVAKIARKGTVPRPIVERIVEHPSWLRAPLIRRALLSNPKLPRDGVVKILRATPKHELKLIAKGTAYPMAIRDAVRRLLGGDR